MNELKPCPFCGNDSAHTVMTVSMMYGGSSLSDWDESHYSCVCDKAKGGCGASIGEYYESADEAAEVWNRRDYNDER